MEIFEGSQSYGESSDLYKVAEGTGVLVHHSEELTPGIAKIRDFLASSLEISHRILHLNEEEFHTRFSFRMLHTLPPSKASRRIFQLKVVSVTEFYSKLVRISFVLALEIVVNNVK